MTPPNGDPRQSGDAASASEAATSPGTVLPATRSARGGRPAREPEPGQIIAGRYRLLLKLGAGGMGSVYRADDAELASAVALKFLPRAVETNPLWLDRFRAEVRLARQISHPNVCRVFDIGQSEEGVYLSMEYVDGEDLGALLKRIGRLPGDKAVDVARQLCFGLAAAHERGVLHRDLKPANVMLDGRGRVRIMDFGVAGIAEELAATGDVAAGTPEYMAPEQLEGVGVSVKSDLYALGLVLFEVFTGRPAYQASTIAELKAERSRGGPRSRPSDLVADLDPAVERVILSCLSERAEDRPSSALAVAAALPGGDPLGAALAAGETPSPELVAASGSRERLSVRAALLNGGIVVLALVLAVVLSERLSALARERPEKSVEVLEDRAREVLERLGFDGTRAESHSGFVARGGYQAAVEKRAGASDGPLAPGLFQFWYRQSPRPIVDGAWVPFIRDLSPMLRHPGEALVRTDGRGRLEALVVVPPIGIGEAPGPMSEAEAKAALFDLAGLDPAAFTETTPERRAPVHADVLRAWEGRVPEWPEEPTLVHMGMTDGKPIFFAIRYPFVQRASGWPTGGASPASMGHQLGNAAFFVAVVGIFWGTGVLAIRNLRARRGDRRGATVGAAAVGLVTALAIALSSDVAPEFSGFFFEGEGYATSVWVGCMFWLFYVALEPAARRLYPSLLVSWARLTRGGWNDPLVGKHVLYGLLAGALGQALLVGMVAGVRPLMNGPSAPGLFLASAAYLEGPTMVAGRLASGAVSAMMFGTGAMLSLVAGRLVFHRHWAAVAGVIGIFVLITLGGIITNPIDGTVTLVVALIPVAVGVRVGLLACVVTQLVLAAAALLAVGTDWTGIASPAWIPAGVLAALLVWALSASLWGRQRTGIS